MLGQDMAWLYKANGGCAGEELKAINISIELGFSGLKRPEKPNSKKCRHVEQPCQFIIHAFSTNHN
jgi:hypothetical protein